MTRPPASEIYRVAARISCEVDEEMHAEYLGLAADEIDRLNAENDRLLRLIARLGDADDGGGWEEPNLQTGRWEHVEVSGYDLDEYRSDLAPIDPADLALLRKAAATNPKDTP